MIKYTEWFPKRVKPVHIGLYQCECCRKLFWWDGEVWRYYIFDNPEWEIRGPVSWRGLRRQAE